MKGMEFSVLGASVSGFGVSGWSAFCARLAGQVPGESNDLPPTSLLSARERRRSPGTVRLSLAVAEAACTQASLDPAEPRAVFASAMGDLEITDYMCATLAEAPEHLSPTRFHNSVHNAASGYWSIGARARGDITAISAHADSACLGLTESVLRLVESPDPVLLVCYDLAASSPIRDVWPAEHPFAAALVIAGPDHSGAMARLRLDTGQSPGGPSILPDGLEQLARDNPAGRLLEVLALVADPPAAESCDLRPERGPAVRIARIRR